MLSLQCLVKSVHAPRAPLRHGSKFIFKEPGAEVVLKLNYHANVATIKHFEAFNGTDLPQPFNDGRRYPVSQTADFDLFSDFHSNLQCDQP